MSLKTPHLFRTQLFVEVRRNALLEILAPQCDTNLLGKSRGAVKARAGKDFSCGAIVPGTAAGISQASADATDKKNMPFFFSSTKEPLPRLFRGRLRGWLALAGVLLVFGATGCGLRTVPPIRYIPLLGAEKRITTTAVLARALRDRDVSIRAQTVKLLGILSQSSDKKVKREVVQVLGMAARDADPGIRLLALERLGQMEEEYGNRYLLAALKDPNPFVRNKVLKVLEARQAAQVQAAQAAQAVQAAQAAQAPTQP